MAKLKDMKMPAPKAQEEEDDIFADLADEDLEDEEEMPEEEDAELGEDLLPREQLLSALEDHGVSPELISQIEEQLGGEDLEEEMPEEDLEGEEEY